MFCQGFGQETVTSGHVRHSVDHVYLQHGWLPVRLPVRLVGWLAGWLDGWLAGWLRKTISEAEVALEDFKDWHTCPTQIATQWYISTLVCKQTQMRVHLPMTVQALPGAKGPLPNGPLVPSELFTHTSVN